MLFVSCLMTTVLSQAFMPREWLQQNATHEDKKMIANLLINNADANLKMTTYVFVSEKSHESAMLKKFPYFVQDYLKKRLSSVCFESMPCQKLGIPFNVSMANTPIKINKLTRHRITEEEIKNFVSESYDWLR